MEGHSEKSPMELLKHHYDETELVCPDCGYEDEEGSWSSETDGREIHYEHECPSCGAVREHTLSLNGE
ncbi:HVO_0649 family zinc finger protein [Haloarcula amylovorans]|uniref:HVO_0649 family zinc finger protein n=1 Tax=Haloarcula amylovorans TaxID=2562280 RepID=UPI001076AF25|nr:HVO_0649 family zinc finger protein [Halomicroarcula amylolytica]